ncbi:hypothetical protein JW824_04025 [bacterium]|nr:hypothetical protein [bacterium]
MINQYKRDDVFRCSQEAHKRFEGKVSVFHVMKEKNCYPQGCLYFKWHCILMEKGNRCIHRYQYIGKNCKGCTYYIEEKVHLQPRLLLTEDQYSRFMEDLEDFENWLENIRYKRRMFGGQIHYIKPWFEQVLCHKASHIKLRGYLLVFKRGFIGVESFDDTFYVRISEKMMQTFQFASRMVVEMEGEIREDRGRIVIHKPRNIEIVKQGSTVSYHRDQALVSLKTATSFQKQPEHCLSCPWGGLADVTDRRDREEKRYRSLYCLKGITDPEGCYIQVTEWPEEK